MLVRIPRWVTASGRQLKLETLEHRLNLAAATTGFHEVCGGGEIDASADEAARAADAVNCFAYDLYEQFQHESGNVVLSPLSIATALAMVHSGAQGETAAQIDQVAHFGSEPGIQSSFRALLDAVSSDGDRPFELEMANALWPQQGLPMRDEFTQGIEANFDGTTQALNYADPVKAADTINKWVDEQTHGKIRDLVVDLDPETKLTLTNSVFFSASWAYRFGNTQTRDFYPEVGDAISVPMMGMVADLRYNVIDGFKILELPYEGQQNSMVILLPHEPGAELSPEALYRVNQWLDGDSRATQPLSISLPKFETTVTSNLKPLLKAMGMPLAFSEDGDFSGITGSQGWYINGATHKAFLEVNEEGVEAAATTASPGGGACFAAGTLVLTPDGERAIEQIEPGDFVLSRHENNVDGAIQPKRVEETFQNESEILLLRVAGQTIRTTKEHPFFVKEQGWTPAANLRSRDLLASDDGQWIEVQETLESTEVETVYNFRVADFRTYFVGHKHAAIWAHNLYLTTVNADRPFHYLIRDNNTSTILFMGRVTNPLETENELTPAGASPQRSRLNALPGDASGDGEVNNFDFFLLAHNYGKTQDAVFADGDFNSDGAVNFADFIIMASNFGASTQS